MAITFDEKLEAAWGLHKIEKHVLEKEIAELRAENEKLREQIAAADLDNIRINYENEKLREALKPFARMAADYEDWETEKITMIVLLYHLRDAAAALKESGDE